MSKKKLVAIIVPCVVAIVVVIVMTTRSPEEAKEPEQVAVSAYNLSEQLFDPELTSLQRDTLWKDYQGKQIKWTSELRDVASGKEGAVAYFLNPLNWTRTEVRALFDENQASGLLQCKEGDLVTYTGVLTSFAEDEIGLTECTFVSLAIAPLWWNKDVDTHGKRILAGDAVLCLGPSTYDDTTKGLSPSIMVIDRETGELLWEDKKAESVLVGVDSRYAYTWQLERVVGCEAGALFGNIKSIITALDAVSGQTSWTSSRADWAGCPLAEWRYYWINEILLRYDVRQEITSRAEHSLVLLASKPSVPELTYEYEGVIYEGGNATYGVLIEGRHALQAIDQEAGDVLWVATFEYVGMTDFSILDGILYVSTDNGVGAFRLPNVTNP